MRAVIAHSAQLPWVRIRRQHLHLLAVSTESSRSPRAVRARVGRPQGVHVARALIGRLIRAGWHGELPAQLAHRVEPVVSEYPITPSIRDSVQSFDQPGYLRPDAVAPGTWAAVGLRLPGCPTAPRVGTLVPSYRTVQGGRADRVVPEYSIAPLSSGRDLPLPLSRELVREEVLKMAAVLPPEL